MSKINKTLIFWLVLRLGLTFIVLPRGIFFGVKQQLLLDDWQQMMINVFCIKSNKNFPQQVSVKIKKIADEISHSMIAHITQEISIDKCINNII